MMLRSFQRVAIVNRGEAAMRLVHAVRELNREQGTELRTIALYTDPDRRAMFVREADEAVALGPATFVDEFDGRRKSSYLDYPRLEQALVAARADAVWVGWGFMAEHVELAELCQRLGLVFVGPEPEVMRRVDDKVAAKRLAESMGLGVAPWAGGPVAHLDEARLHAEKLGYPVVVKAAAGGGGLGIRQARSGDELAQAFELVRTEGLELFGDPTVLVECLITDARNVEVQVVADSHGNAWAVGVRDCSAQRQHQKVLAESSSPTLTPDEQRQACQAAIRMCRAVDYRGAATVEFFFDPASRRFSFLEINPRLQAEHGVTEAVTGLDLVKLQLHLAMGGRLDGEAPSARGYAVGVRLTAEDPVNGFAPTPGPLELLRLVTGPGVRVDAGVEEGDEVVPELDPTIAKVVAWGSDREEALSRLTRALSQSAVVVQGGTTNRCFLLELLNRPEVLAGEVELGWLDRLVERGGHLSDRGAEVALLEAAIDACDAELALERANFSASALRGRPEISDQLESAVELRHRGHDYRLHVYRTGSHRYQVVAGGRPIDVEVEPFGRFERRLSWLGRSHRLVIGVQGIDHLVEVDGVAHRVSRTDLGTLRAPAPAIVTAVMVKPGDQVAAGDRVAVLEAMKVEMALTADFAARVRKVYVTSNVQVDPGAPLVQLEPLGRPSREPAAERVDLAAAVRDAAATAPSLAERCERVFRAVQGQLLGFDVEPSVARGLVSELAELSRELAVDDPGLRQREDEVLATFADVCSLARTMPDPDELEGEEPVSSPQEHLFTYLRFPDRGGRGLPRSFLDELRRALAHYGVSGLEQSPALEESLFWLARSQHRLDLHVPLVMAVLDRRLEHLDALRPLAGPLAGEDFRALLDGLVAASERRYPAVTDLARECRYLYYDQPLFEAARARVYQEMEQHLAALERRPDTPDREQRLEALIGCPQPVNRFLTARFAAARPDMRLAMLEVLTRRYYRIRQLRQVRTLTVDGQPAVTAEYDHEGVHLQVVTTYADYGELAEAVRRLLPFLAELSGRRVLLDVFAWRPEGMPVDADATAAELHDALEAVGLPPQVGRVAVSVTGPDPRPAKGVASHFTWAHNEFGLVEDEVCRGLHPMMGKRLDLWRLENFRIERLPSAEDVYLFRGVAHANPRDERLFALAEVRDLTPVHDASGRVIELPHLERMLMEALAAIRLFQSRRPVGRRLEWNRVLLYVRPPFELGLDEVSALVDRLEPATMGLGLEKIVLRVRIPDPATGQERDTSLDLVNPTGTSLQVSYEEPSDQPLQPLDEYVQKVVQMRRRGMVYPFETVKLLTPPPGSRGSEFPPGEFVEHDLDDQGGLVPVERPYGLNKANLVVGVITNYTAKHPEGMKRVILLGDPSRSMGSLAEPECRRINAALDLAEEMGLPVEWFAHSAGAKISMESGTENMDWISRVLRRLIEFTQAGHEVNVVVNGINVGAQPYWNAEATMLMHTKGILVMTPDGAMVLTGKQSLDYSGGVSAEDNAGIGGYERVMGPNGQAQYWAPDLSAACHILLRHYEHAYVAPGERFPRRAATTDPIERDVRGSPHPDLDGTGFRTVGDVVSDETNPGRKKPFDTRSVMASAVDQDHPPLERWGGMWDAETVIVWDAHLGGYPVCLLGIEAHDIPRRGLIPADGPNRWTSGTLFPHSSKKAARAINAASANRPLVVLATLAGFDGSPESMRQWQLEFGAEIGRAVVNFRGPIVFCVVSRYHGGAFVVFSTTLNESLEMAALEGSYASVIGGAPAAAVVFSREVDARTDADPRVQELEAKVATAEGAEKAHLRAELGQVRAEVRSEKLGQVADEFATVHSVQRAQRMGSVHHIIPPAALRPYLVEALERGMARELDRDRAEGALSASVSGSEERR